MQSRCFTVFLHDFSKKKDVKEELFSLKKLASNSDAAAYSQPGLGPNFWKKNDLFSEGLNQESISSFFF